MHGYSLRWGLDWILGTGVVANPQYRLSIPAARGNEYQVRGVGYRDVWEANGTWKLLCKHNKHTLSHIYCLNSTYTSGYWRQPRVGYLSATCPFLSRGHFSPFSAPWLYSRERQWASFPDCPSKEALGGVKHTNTPPHTDIWVWDSMFTPCSERSKMTPESKCLTHQIICCPQFETAELGGANSCCLSFWSISHCWKEA